MRKHRYKFAGLAAAAIVLFVALSAGNAYIAQSAAARASAPAPAVGGPPAASPNPSSSPTPAPTSAATPAASDPGTGAMTLVVYFSYEGATRRVAELVSDTVGGELYEIVPENPYPNDFDETADLGQDELNDGFFPTIAGEVPDVSQYDTVFLGYPIWWGEQPMVVQTFMRDNDLSHATIVPFVTHDGSRFGNSLDVLSEYYPTATVLEGYAARGDEIRSDPDAARGGIEEWLSGLGF